MGSRKASSGPERVLDEDALYESAVRALARRARTTREIRLLLGRKKASKGQIEAVIQRLRGNGYLDDARFARNFASWKVVEDLQGKARVRRDLRARGVGGEAAEKAVTSAYEDVDEAALLRQYLKRKVRISAPLSKPSTVRSLFGRLLRAGFRSDTIIQELKKILPGRLPIGRQTARRAPEQPESEAASETTWNELLDSLSDSENEAEIN